MRHGAMRRRGPFSGVIQTSIRHRRLTEVEPDPDIGPIDNFPNLLLNDCIGPDQNGLRDSQPYLLGGLQIDHKNESIALLNRQVRRIVTFKNSAYISCRHPAAAFEVRAIARKTSTSNSSLHIKHRRQLVSQ